MSNINNKNKSWIEKHKILTIFISVIAILIICIGLPSLINRVLYWDIKTHNSTDGEWLSFWGSFLGGIFGGLATLGAILITREMAKKDNEELKESISMEREPKVIPIKKNAYLYKTYGSPCMFNEIKTSSEVPRCSDIIELTLVNVGKEAAIQIEVFWEKPLNIVKTEYLTDDDLEVCNNFFDEFDENENIKVEKEYISSLQEVEIGLNAYTEMYIRELSSKLIDNFRENNEDGIYIRKNIKAGTINIKCKNIYDKSYNKSYDMEISIFEMDRSKELYTINIDFNLIEDEG
ncbi:TPA: hypothetical protein P1J70_001761 [Clostridioides difficile]|nr:hypothetical protein [Clostridioides difficile]AXU28705.1 hypothetical protein CDIF102859_03004 [Clostridioides difficile]AXU32501.1 hypothetical protein CDIF102860_03029 [Clostridioides difficile]AXU36289.1 hypothetical protein CDIF102978_03029 [Clostridioides difficile]EAA0000247.1 hypothetical protein [Clostridioides difficile]EGT3663608.1 hypothetical protein [Clostridioides difficile]